METSVGISSGLLDRLLAEAAAAPAIEVCGLLFGDDRGIAGASACRNVADTPATSFEIDPAALIAAHRAMRSGGPRLIGHYHSHPGGQPDPSPRDAAAATAGDLWLILGAGEARLWRAVDGGAWLDCFERIRLDVTPPCAAALRSP